MVLAWFIAFLVVSEGFGQINGAHTVSSITHRLIPSASLPRHLIELHSPHHHFAGLLSAVTFLEAPGDPYQYPYLTQSADPAAADLEGQSNVVPLDITKAPQGECGSPLDINSKISCVAATAQDVDEPDENMTKAEVLGQPEQQDPPVLGVPMSQADPPETMSRKEFFQYVVSQAKQDGARKGRDVGIVAGYVAAKMEAIEQLKKKLEQEAQAIAADEQSQNQNQQPPTNDDGLQKLHDATNLHITSEVLSSLANGNNVPLPRLATGEDTFSDPENRMFQEKMYHEALPVLKTVQEIGGALSAAGSVVDYVADELTRG
eukprot:c12272_g2_i1.p1 GENE.c12272_g2_i1~~c12272_g2_i1.p1  ORF type:complete len:318 (+),score=97.15 c12272_g2_i1:40-993(+)